MGGLIGYPAQSLNAIWTERIEVSELLNSL